MLPAVSLLFMGNQPMSYQIRLIPFFVEQRVVAAPRKQELLAQEAAEFGMSREHRSVRQ